MVTALILVCSLATVSTDCTRDNALDVVYIPATFDSAGVCMMPCSGLCGQQLDGARSAEE
jgi:hypothetical protein